MKFDWPHGIIDSLVNQRMHTLALFVWFLVSTARQTARGGFRILALTLSYGAFDSQYFAFERYYCILRAFPAYLALALYYITLHYSMCGPPLPGRREPDDEHSPAS